MATKKELQEKYAELYGEAPKSKLTKQQLEELIEAKLPQPAKVDNVEHPAVNADGSKKKLTLDAIKKTEKKVDDDKQPPVKKEAPKSKKQKAIYTTDRTDLKQVLGTRTSIRRKGKDGKVTGGTEYYGIPKNK